MSKKQTIKRKAIKKPAGKAAVIEDIFRQSIVIRQRILSDKKFLSKIEQAAKLLIGCVKSGGVIYACGNGGSSNDAMHLCEELVARYKRERPGIKAMHFMDSAVITCWSNDYAFESVFERQAETFCSKKDVLIAISTSGNSDNVNKAVQAAKKKGAKTIALSGKDGGVLKKLADLALIAPSNETERIQEIHITLIHILCELLET